MESTTSDLVSVNRLSQSTLSPEEKMFRKLKSRVEKLKEEREKQVQLFDECLSFYHLHLHPQERVFFEALKEHIEILYSYYAQTDEKAFSRIHRMTLKELILVRIGQMMEIMDFVDVPDQIKQIFKELKGVDCEDKALCQLKEIKEDFEGMLKKNGVDVDLSGIDLRDRQEEVISKLLEAVKSGFSGKDESIKEKRRTKRELEKQRKREEFQEMRKKNTATIYKQLAKALHPDLEQDSQQKAQKEEMMKRLTTAYQDNDLHALLAIEWEWMNASGSDKAYEESSQQLQAYNALLKEQIKILEEEIGMIVLSPRYFKIQRFFDGCFEGMLSMTIAAHMLKGDIQEMQKLNRHLKTSGARVVKEVLDGYLAKAM